MAVLVTYNGNGRALSFGSEKEGVTYSYSSLSSVYLVTEDYGLISDVEFLLDDYGSISELHARSENYNYLQNPNPSFGFIKNITSTTITIFELRSIGGVEFALQGGSYESFGSPFIGYGLTKQFGGLSESSSPSTYVGNGSLFGFSGAAERVSFSYNESSVALLTNNDYGFISSSEIDSEDYGSIDDPSTITNFDNYGLISLKLHNVPYGALNFVGDAAKTTRFRLRYFGSGSLFTLNSSSESYSSNPPESTALFRFSGSATESTTPSVAIGSGTLFSFITKEERRTYSYNSSSVAFGFNIDYGFISSSEIDSEDYGSIDDPSTITNFDNYGSLDLFDRRPYGALNFVGDAAKTTRFRLRYFGSGSLFGFVSGTESSSSNPPESTALFRFSGSATDIKNTISEVSSGTLFSFITKEERRTYSYNSSSVVGDILYDDYGNVVDTHELSLDYGLVANPTTSYENYYYLQNPEGRRPYGFLRFASELTEQNTASYFGSGSLFAFIGSSESSSSNPPESTVLFKFSGSATDIRNTISEVSSGTLFSFITKEERRTYSYNSSSVVDESSVDYGFISSVHQELEDYGLITESPGLLSSENYGLITTKGRRPYGFLRFASELTEQNTASYFGSGSLFAFIGAAEATTPAPEVISGLFRISGAAAESITPTTEIGSGTLFSFITKEERRTYSYNSSSVVGEFTAEDYGFISATPQSFEDYGNLVSSPVLYDDYNTLSSSTRKPYGFLSFSGGATNLQSTLSYFGRGGLFAITGAAESVAFVPQTTGLFKLVSGTTESFGVGLYTGSGSLFTFIKKEESRVFRYIGSTETTISGSLVEKNTETYKGTGKLFAYTGSANVVGYNPPTTGLFKFLPTGAKERFIGSIFTSGVIPINLDPGSAVYDPNEKIRLASALESTTIKPFIPPSGFRVQGEVGRIFFQYGEVGTGRFTIAGEAIIKTNPIHFGSGFVNVRGTSQETTVPAPHIGSGSLFGFIGGAEATVPAPEIGSGLFKFFGSATDIKETNVEIGSGILGRINIESNIIVRFVYPTDVQLSVIGTAVQRKLNSYDGSGRFTTLGSADIYFANKFFSNGDPLRIRTTDTPQSSTKTFIGSGALFGFVSATESVGANPPLKTTAFRVTGSAIVANTETFSGTGTIFGRQATAIGGKVLDLSPATIAEYADEIISNYASLPVIAIRSTILDIDPKLRIVGAFESSSASPQSKDRAIKISGILEKEVSTSTFIGSGNLFSFDSAKESASFVPAKTTALFEFNGNAPEKFSNTVIGAGSLFGFGSSANSVLIDYSSTSETTKDKFPQKTLIRISGSLSESFVPATHIGSGNLSSFTGASESRAYTEDNRVLFEFSGSSDNAFRSNYSGTGRIFAFTGDSRSYLYNYDLTQKAFTIFGSTFESFGKSTYFGQCETQFIGKSADEKINYDPPKPIILYII